MKVVAKINTLNIKRNEFYNIIKEDYIHGLGTVYYIIDGTGTIRRYMRRYFYDINELRDKKISELLK
jgi:hypothetical protein